MQPNASTRLVRSGSPAACVFAGTMAIATLLAAHSARAASYSWTPTAAGAAYEWNTTTQDNWGTGVAGSFPNAVDDTANLNINLAGAQTVSLNQAVTLGALNLGDATTSFFATTLQNGTGGSLTFDVSSGNAAINKVTAANTAADIISATITLNDNLVVNNAATASTGSLTISGNIGDGSSGKTLTKIGVGTLILSGTNAYTGGTSINNGSLQFNSSGAIADSGRNVTVASGAVAAAGYAMDNAFLNRLSENSNAAVIALGAASSNNLDLSSATGANLPNAFLGATGAFAYSGSLTPGSNGFRLGGGGGTLAASSVLGGTTNGLTVGGNVTLQSSTVNTFTGGVNLTNGGMIGGVSATLGNPNTLTLNFANLTAAPNNNLIDATNVLTLGGGRLHLTGKNSAASSQTFASTTLNANTTSIVSMTVGTGTASVGITLGTITRSPGSTLYYAQQGGTLPNGTTLLAPTTTANEASGILAPWSFASASAYAANNGSGQIVAYTVPGGNSFTTAAGLSGMNDANANFQMTGTNGSTYTITAPIKGNTLTLTNGSTAGWIIANGGNSITLNGILAIGSGAGSSRTISGAGNLEIGANKELVINVFRPLTISCPIVDNGTGVASPVASALTYTSIVTSDAGYSLTLSGSAANTYTGTTTVAGGGLTLNKTASVNAIPGNVTVSSGSLIWAANNQIADAANLTLFGTAKVSGTPTETIASVTTSGNTGGFAFTGSTNFTITGALSLTNNIGPGSVTASSYGLSGTAKMTCGSLSLDNANYTVGTALADTPTLTLNGDLTGANTSTIITAATAPKFVLNGAATHNHNFNISSGTTTISPPISETASTTASLTKTGAGTLTLTGQNTYTGDTLVEGGTLSLSPTVAGGYLADGADVYLKNTTTILNLGNAATTDTIRSFYIDGVQQASGTWGAIGSGATNTTARITGTGLLNVTVGSGFTLTYTAGANGSVSGTTPQTVASGGNGAAVTAVPNTGYHFVNWSDSSTANPRTDSSVMANVSVTASFAINTVAYNTWAATYAGGGFPAGDSNIDGVQNGIAFFMNATGPATNPGLVGNTVTWPNGGNIPATEYGTQFVVQTSTDLVVWQTVPSNDAGLSNTNGSVSYTLPGGQAKLFCRLVVTPQ